MEIEKGAEHWIPKHLSSRWPRPQAKNAQKLAVAIEAWKVKVDSLESGDIFVDDYELWEASLTSD